MCENRISPEHDSRDSDKAKKNCKRGPRTTLGTGLARTGTNTEIKISLSNTAKRIFTHSARRRRRNRSRNAGGVVRRCAMGLLEPPAVLRSLQKSFSSIRVAGSNRVKPLARPAACRRRPVSAVWSDLCSVGGQYDRSGWSFLIIGGFICIVYVLLEISPNLPSSST